MRPLCATAPLLDGLRWGLCGAALPASGHVGREPTSTTVLKEALAVGWPGLCVLPPKEDGSKAPLVKWKERQSKRPAPEQMRRWYVEGGSSGVGVVCGRIDRNLELFEFDDPTAYTLFKDAATAVGLGDLIERIEAGYLEDTPGGSVHWLYRCEEIVINPTLARRPKLPDEMSDPEDKIKVLIETRGEGGYAILAPSGGRVYPTCKRYRLLNGGFDQIVTITPQDRANLWALVRRRGVTRVLLAIVRQPRQPPPAC